MLWRRRKPRWLIDPSHVQFGSVTQNPGRNLSRSHVRIRYRRQSEAQFVPLAEFIQHCNEAIRRGRSLDVEDLLVAPILKRGNPRFFDSLTDWGPATGRANARRHRREAVPATAGKAR